MVADPEVLDNYLRSTGLPPTAVQREMADHADREEFPIVGPTVGSLLCGMAVMIGARSVFEFGSGFGYSASWFLRGMTEDGSIVLTEHDRDELDLAKSFFERSGDAGRVTFEHGDAIEIVDRYPGPFDIVLIDHEKSRYVDGFEAIRDKVAPGGVVVADNMMHGPFEFREIADGVAGRSMSDGRVEGVVHYLDHVNNADGFVTSVVPLGSGIAVTVKRR
mgnify:CR=1 FL=1